MVIGQIGQFEVSSGNWEAYIERVEMYLLANKIEDAMKLPTLITIMGEEAYELLATLASPKKPSELEYKVAIALLTNHLQPKPSVLAERFKFRQRRQNEGESIATYVADLKKLAKHCDFEAALEENLRDQVVCGLRSDVVRQRLFAEERLTYKKAISLAMSLEAAERDAGAIVSWKETSGGSAVVNKIYDNQCRACGGEHRAEGCRYKDFVWSAGKKTGT